VRRADHTHPKGIRARGIGAEELAAIDLGGPVDAGGALANGGCRFRRESERFVGRPADRAVRCNGFHRFDDLQVAGAATEHAAKSGFDVGARRRLRLGETGGGCHQHAGCANATLGRAVSKKGTAQVFGQAARAAALDGRDRAPAALGCGHEAGADGRAVAEDGAGTAVASIAADLGAGQMQAIAQHVGQRFGGDGLDDDSRAVELERERAQFSHGAPPKSARR
jgi:hypothetical protein